MSRKAEIATAISTLGCAIGIGFIMQSGEVAEARYSTGALAPLTSEHLNGARLGRASTYDFLIPRRSAPLEVNSIELTSGELKLATADPASEYLIKAAADPAATPPNSGVSTQPQSETCDITARAKPIEAAMVSYRLDAPCFASARVTITHRGLRFSQVLSDDGSLELLVPALSHDSLIVATFPNGRLIKTVAVVEDVSLFDRVVLQWQGDARVEVHAREFGAGYGEEGHVWAGAARNFSAVSEGRGGYLTVLGDAQMPNPQRAEVYTFPTALTAKDAGVNLTVEAKVTDDTCGTEINAKALQFRAGRQISAQDLSLAMPGCEAVGSFLVLNNLLQNLTVASK